jgi:pimeloyl-ACP methyl ester carboxylesterase
MLERMDARDVCAIGDALAEGLDGTTRRVEEISDAVARRSFAAVGPARVLPQAIYERITPRVYGTVRTVGPAAIRSGALGLGQALGPGNDRAQSSRGGKAILSAVNGVLGDALARRGNGLALRMALRVDGADVQPTEEGLAGALGEEATGRLAVFVHGFGEHDDSWRWYSEAHWDTPGISYGELLRRDLGFTPLYLHYNTGRSVGANAAQLSVLLDLVATNWPTWIDEIVLVGHSAGGRVARGAVRHGSVSGAGWVGQVSAVFTLGTPRTAQAAERAARTAARTLERLPETRPLAELLEGRSAGLKDLGAYEDENWIPASVELVELSSDETGVSHFRLLNHPDIYRELRGRISARSVPVPVPIAREGRYGRAATAVRSRRRFRRR